MEYRGFWVKDSIDGISQVPHHVRTDPNKKTTFLHFTSTFSQDDWNCIPGDITAMPKDSLEIFIVDDLEGTDNQMNFLSWNNRKSIDNKRVTHNIRGANRFYYGYPSLTDSPFKYQDKGADKYDDMSRNNAIVFFNYDRFEENMAELDTLIFGACWSAYWKNSFNNTDVNSPNLLSRIVLLRKHMTRQLGNKDYYKLLPDSIRSDTIKADANWLEKNIFAHEFGHSLGMQDLDSSEFEYSLMYYNTLYTSIGKLIKASTGYSDSSFSETGITIPKGVTIQKE